MTTPTSRNEEPTVELTRRFGNLDASLLLLSSMNARPTSDSERTLIGTPTEYASHLKLKGSPLSIGGSGPTDELAETLPRPTGLGGFAAVWKFLGIAEKGEDSSSAGKDGEGSVAKEQETTANGNSEPQPQHSSDDREVLYFDADVDEECDTIDPMPAGAKSPTTAKMTKKQKKAASHDQRLAQWKRKQAEAHETQRKAKEAKQKKGKKGKKASDTEVSAVPQHKSTPTAAQDELEDDTNKDSSGDQPASILKRKANVSQQQNVSVKEVSTVENTASHGYSLRPRDTLKPPMANLIPSSIPPPRTTTTTTSHFSHNDYVQTLNDLSNRPPPSPVRSKRPITPKKHKGTSSGPAFVSIERMLELTPGADWTPSERRHASLQNKLIATFPEDRKWLISPSQNSNHTSAPNGLHIFVDASNIFIGFYEHMKAKYKVSRWTESGISFDSFVLLMERRRPVSRRVLAGSLPHVPAFDKARDIGYEMNVLNKVQKTRELTSRQKYFQENDLKYKRRSGYRSAGGAGKSGPESCDDAAGSGLDPQSAPETAPAKWVEQGVDEILHLKILESVCDAVVGVVNGEKSMSDSPPTMIVATGDAEVAEYSAGFLKQVERALMQGWYVELVGWKRNISSAYHRRSWTDRWQGRFRVIELDDFAEELRDG